MKCSSSARGRATKLLSVTVFASLLSGLLSSFAASAQSGVPASTPAPAPQNVSGGNKGKPGLLEKVGKVIESLTDRSVGTQEQATQEGTPQMKPVEPRQTVGEKGTKAAGAEAPYPYPDWPAVAKTAAPIPQKGAEEQNTEVPPQATTQPSAEEAAKRNAWRKKMLQTPRPAKGCFTATFPETEWRTVPCKTPPHKLYPPRLGGTTRADIVGGAGPDFSGVVTGNISKAEGLFDSVTGVTSECAVQCPNQTCPTNPTCTGAPANEYSLQLNTKPFTTQTCNASPNPAGCQGWEQFVYPSSGGGFIQYWLENYGPAGTACPTPTSANCQAGVQSDGWCPFSFTTGGNVYCVINAVNSAPAPSEPITSLSGLTVTAAVTEPAIDIDSITVTVGGTTYTAPGNNYFPDLKNSWTDAEFNVFGDGNGDQAVFNTGSTIVVRTKVDSGTSVDPVAKREGFTGESNNLTLVNPSCAFGGSSPAIVFTESNAAGATAPQCTPAPVCSASTDCTGELTISCAGPDVGVSFNGNCKDPNGEPVPCYAGFTGASTVSAGGNVDWIGSTTSPNVAEACTETSAGENCILVTAPVPAPCPGPPTPPVPQCGLNEKWCFKFEPPRCAPIKECLVTPPHP